MTRMAAQGIRDITAGMSDQELLTTWGTVVVGRRRPPAEQPRAPQATGARRAYTGAADAEQPQAPAWQPRGTVADAGRWTADEWEQWRKQWSWEGWHEWMREQDRKRGWAAPATQPVTRAPAASEPEETQSEASPRAAPQINWGSRTLNKSRNIQERGIPYTRMRKFS